MRRTSRPFFAGTWINLQDAYVAENNVTGDWGQIGYSAPGAQKSSGSYESKEFTYTGGVNSSKGTWNAKNTNKLNDCEAGTAGWALEATATGNGSGTMSVALGTTDSKCTNLTPSFLTLVRDAQ